MRLRKTPGFEEIRFQIHERYYQALVELAGARDVHGFVRFRMEQYVKWRHRDKRSAEFKAKQAAKRAERASRHTTVSMKEFLS